MLVIAAIVLIVAIGGGTAVICSATSGPEHGATQVAATRATLTTRAVGTSSAVRYADGTTVTTVGITEMPGAPKRGLIADLFGGPTAPLAQSTTWWGSDGAPIAAVPLARLGTVWPGEAPGRRQVRFIFAMHGPAVGKGNLSIRVDGVTSSASSSATFGNETRFNYCGSIPADVGTAPVRLGLSKGPWRDDVTLLLATAQPTGAASFRPIRDDGNSCLVEVNDNGMGGGEREWQVGAILANGQRVSATESQSDTRGRSTLRFPCRKDQIAKLVGMSRAYEWQTMTVAVKPVAAGTGGVAGRDGVVGVKD